MYIYNVVDASPSEEWESQKESWVRLRNHASASMEFSPLTIKALYLTGNIYLACESIDLLFHNEKYISTTFFPAYSIFASIVDLLGRCISGNTTLNNPTDDIKMGFQWLASPDPTNYKNIDKDKFIILSTKSNWGAINCKYTIQNLIDLRHYSSHGQAAARDIPEFDYGILGEISPILSIGLEKNLQTLEEDIDICTNLSKALILPYRSRPIFDILLECHGGIDPFPIAVGKRINKYNWVPKYIKLI